MKKKIILTTLISTCIFISACSNKQVTESGSNNKNTQESTKTEVQQSTSNNNSTNKSKEGYQIAKNIYKSKKVTISYPQISNLGNNNKEKAINELIKNSALQYVSKGINDKLNSEINYNLTLSNANLLSVQFFGEESFDGASHPTNIFYTTNIDIKNAKILTLSDVVKINESLAQSFKNGKYIPWDRSDDPKIREEFQFNIVNFVNSLDDNELIEQFKKSDYKDENIRLPVTSFYIKGDAIGISISVPHASGDHIEYEIKYNDIKNNMDIKNAIWKGLF